MSFHTFQNSLDPTEDPTENPRPNVAWHHPSYAFVFENFPALSTGSTGLNEFLRPDHYNSQSLYQFYEHPGSTNLSLQAEYSTAGTTHTWPWGTDLSGEIDGTTNTTTQDAYIPMNWGSSIEEANLSLPTDEYTAAFNLAVGPGLDFYSNASAIVPTPYTGLDSGMAWNQNTFFPPPTEAQAELLQTDNFALPGHSRRAIPGAPPRQAPNKSRVLCLQCPKTFSREPDLRRHIKGTHQRIYDYMCPFEGCGKGFSRKDKLKDHQKARTHFVFN